MSGAPVGLGTGAIVTPGAAGPGRRRNRRMRLWLALVGGVMALLCLGGVGVVVSLYDNATKIKRSAPDAVVDNFLRAYLVNRDDEEAALYECKSGGDFTKIAALRSDVAGREKQYSIAIRFTWTSLTIETEGGRTTVSSEVFRAISDGSERTSDRWQFQMVDQDGWRVCGASQVS
jgi:hypothetical protein